MTHEELFDDNPRPTKMLPHTPEPWGVNKGRAFNPERWGSIERRWLDLEANPEDQLHVETIAEVCDGDANIGEADAWRIVDCVNACTGIKNPMDAIVAAKNIVRELRTVYDFDEGTPRWVIALVKDFEEAIGGANE